MSNSKAAVMHVYNVLGFGYGLILFEGGGVLCYLKR